MAKFAETYPNKEFVQQVAAQIPQGHNVVRKRYGGRGDQDAARIFCSMVLVRVLTCHLICYGYSLSMTGQGCTDYEQSFVKKYLR